MTRRAHVLVTLLDPLTGQRIEIPAGHVGIPTGCPPRLSEVLDVLRGFVSQTEHTTHHRTATEPGDQP